MRPSVEQPDAEAALPRKAAPGAVGAIATAKPQQARAALWRWYLVALFVAAILHGLLYALIVPPFDAPDENAHYEYARLMWEMGRPPEAEDRSPTLRAAVEQLMRERGVGLTRRLPDGREQLVFSAELGRQPPAYYALAALAYGLTRERSIPVQVVAMRLVSIALLGLLVVLVAVTARRAFPGDELTWLAAPLLVLFLPGLTFIGAAVNNDILAVLAVSLTVYGLVLHVQRRPHGLALTAAGIVLALLAKRTAAAALPLGLLVLGLDRAHRMRRRLRRRTALALALGALVLGATTVAVAIGPTDRPAHWLLAPADAGQLTDSAHSGALGLSLQAAADTHALAVQYLDRESVFRVRGRVATGEVWVRAVDALVAVSLFVGDGTGERSTSLVSGPEWRALRVTRAIAADAPSVYLKLRVDQDVAARAVLIDDALLAVQTDTAGNLDANLLQTGGFEDHAWELRPAAARLLRLVHLDPYMLSVVLDPERYSWEAMEGYGFLLRFAFESFWARFGWLSIPVAAVWYDALLVVCGLALLGLPLSALRWRYGRQRRVAAPGVMAVLVLGALLTMTMALVPYLAGALPQEWPQGRYVYPGVLPLALLATYGLRAWLPDRYAAFGLLAVACGLAAFDAVCLVGYLLPHYYGI